MNRLNQSVLGFSPPRETIKSSTPGYRDRRPRWLDRYAITRSSERNALPWSLQTPDRTGPGSEVVSQADRCVCECMCVRERQGRIQGDPLSECTPLAAPQKSNPIPDSQITYRLPLCSGGTLPLRFPWKLNTESKKICVCVLSFISREFST